MDRSKFWRNEGTEYSNSISHHARKSTPYSTLYSSNHTASQIGLNENNPQENPMMSKVTWNGKLRKS